MPEFTIPYQPTEKQRLFHRAKEDEVLYGGAAGGGKSKAIVMDALLRALRYPGTTAYIFRRTYPELEDTVIREALRSYPEGLGRYSQTRHEWALPNGSVICFRHCQTAADRYRYKGAEIQWLYFDELTSFDAESYEYLKTRLRARRALGVTPVVRAATNPGDIGHGWVRRYFVDDALQAAGISGRLNAAMPVPPAFTRTVWSGATGRARTYSLRFIPSLAAENPHIGEDYLYQLEQKPKALRDALLYGDWNAFEGQVFTEWRDDPAHYQDQRFSHVVAPFPVPVEWPRYFSFDHGYTRPFSCGWWAIAPDGAAYRYREWYGCEKDRPNTGLRLTPREIARGIAALEREEAADGIPILRVADPAIFDESRGESVARQMEPQNGQPGVYFHRGDNARLAGKMRLHERLRFDSGGRAGLYVFSTCRDFIRTVPLLPYSLTQPEDVDTAAEDHIYDETRYFCMARPMPPREAPRRRRPVLTPFTEAEE